MLEQYALKRAGVMDDVVMQIADGSEAAWVREFFSRRLGEEAEAAPFLRVAGLGGV